MLHAFFLNLFKSLRFFIIGLCFGILSHKIRDYPWLDHQGQKFKTTAVFLLVSVMVLFIQNLFYLRGGHTQHCSRHTLALCSGIIPGGVWKTFGVPGIKPWSAVCKASTLPTVLSSQPLLIFLKGRIFLRNVLKIVFICPD